MKLANLQRLKFTGLYKIWLLWVSQKSIENQTQSLEKINKSTARDASEWFASKFIDVNAAIHGKSWAIAQLYRTHCKIETCKKDKSGVCDSK